jgi:hypothetical protein
MKRLTTIDNIHANLEAKRKVSEDGFAIIGGHLADRLIKEIHRVSSEIIEGVTG